MSLASMGSAMAQQAYAEQPSSDEQIFSATEVAPSEKQAEELFNAGVRIGPLADADLNVRVLSIGGKDHILVGGGVALPLSFYKGHGLAYGAYSAVSFDHTFEDGRTVRVAVIFGQYFGDKSVANNISDSQGRFMLVRLGVIKGNFTAGMSINATPSDHYVPVTLLYLGGNFDLLKTR